MLYFLMKGKSQKKHSLGEKERKVLVICFTNGLTNGMDTQRQIKPVFGLSAELTCCLLFPCLTRCMLSASESCLSDQLRLRTRQETQAFLSCQSSWWRGQFAGLCKVCRGWKSSLSARQQVSHIARKYRAQMTGVCICDDVCMCVNSYAQP